MKAGGGFAQAPSSPATQAHTTQPTLKRWTPNAHAAAMAQQHSERARCASRLLHFNTKATSPATAPTPRRRTTASLTFLGSTLIVTVPIKQLKLFLFLISGPVLDVYSIPTSFSGRKPSLEEHQPLYRVTTLNAVNSETGPRGVRLDDL